MNHLRAAAVALMIVVSGCSEDDTEPPVGTWAFSCRELFPGAGLYFAGTNTTTASDWEIRLAFSATAGGCAAPIMSFRAHGPLTVGDPVEVPAGATAIDFIVTARYLTLHDEAARGVLATLGCDASGFALGAEVNLNAMGCGGFAASLQACPADYDIFTIEGDTLYIGKRPAQGDICAPERRPTELDRSWPFIKQ
jgi:hypothetical protein